MERTCPSRDLSTVGIPLSRRTVQTRSSWTWSEPLDGLGVVEGLVVLVGVDGGRVPLLSGSRSVCLRPLSRSLGPLGRLVSCKAVHVRTCTIGSSFVTRVTKEGLHREGVGGTLSPRRIVCRHLSQFDSESLHL